MDEYLKYKEMSSLKELACFNQHCQQGAADSEQFIMNSIDLQSTAIMAQL